MKKLIFTLMLFCAFAQFSFSQLEIPDCGELYISEMVEGSNKNRAVEIYNPTSEFVDLSNYSLKVFASGPNNPNVMQLMGFLPPKEVHVCGHPQADPFGILPKCDVTSNELKFDGNDAIGLYKNDTLIDVIGVIGVDPGNTGWMVGTGFTKNNTLVRGFDVRAGSPYWNVNELTWLVFPNDDTLQLGKHESVCAGAFAFFKVQQVTISESFGTYTLPLKVESGMATIQNGSIRHNPDLDCIDPIEADHTIDYFTPNSPNAQIQFQIDSLAGFESDPVTLIGIDIVNDSVYEDQDEIICLQIVTAGNITAVTSVNQQRWAEMQIIIEDNDPPTSIEERMQKNIKVYPTITENKLFIEMKKHRDEVEIGIYNSFGQLVKSMVENGHDGTIELSVHELSRGMYIISFEGKEWHVTKKFVRD